MYTRLLWLLIIILSMDDFFLSGSHKIFGHSLTEEAVLRISTLINYLKSCKSLIPGCLKYLWSAVHLRGDKILHKPCNLIINN